MWAASPDVPGAALPRQTLLVLTASFCAPDHSCCQHEFSRIEHSDHPPAALFEEQPAAPECLLEAVGHRPYGREVNARCRCVGEPVAKSQRACVMPASPDCLMRRGVRRTSKA